MSVEDFDGCSAEVLDRLLADEDLDMATSSLLGRACRFFTSPQVSAARAAGVSRASFVCQENDSQASAAAGLLLRAHPRVEQEKRVHINMSAKLKEFL